MKAIKHLLAGVGAAFVWGFFAIPLRKLLAFTPYQILYFRVFIAVIVMLTVMLFFKKRKLKSDIQHFTQLSASQKTQQAGLILLSSVLLIFNWLSYIYAVNLISLTSAAFAYLVCPLLTALGGFLILKEKFNKYKIAAMLLAFLAVSVLATGSFYDIIWAVFIAALYAAYLVIQKKITGFDKFNLLGIQLSLAGLLLLPFFFWFKIALPHQSFFWIDISIISIIFTVLPLFLSLYALIKIPSSTMGIIIYINPIISFTVAVCLYDEKIALSQIPPYLLLFFAIILFNLETLKAIYHKTKR